MEAAGYQGTAELHTDERIFPNAEILKEWVKTMIRPFMCRVPVLRQGQFVDDWIQEYLSTTGQRGTGPVVLVDRNLLVIARKERA
jgi:trans-aconitate methyltransferase